MAKMINIFLKCLFLVLIAMTAFSQNMALAADCKPTTDTYTTDVQTEDGSTAASQQYQVENSC
ncbi:hypothetical protein MKW98_017989 [Papaver atlanticum]|uniref:Secreted protein n=1 Tax=Papaver atlanticum TaxID=357466 RepID=A0AAD4TFD5_9MAGN|nr:hypothetical protein MKW98_017989 [Papaver atlanticum]